MFYSQVILSRKGPLGKIWLAAHFDKKLSKNQIFTTDITNTVDAVLNPNTQLALRVSGNLMLGIVRIYSKKVKYLMIDCTEAMWKMKLAFKPGKVDMDPSFLQLTIDDNRHYGNLFTDEADLFGLENMVFATQLPTLTVSRLGYLDDDSVFTDYSSDIKNLSSDRSINSSIYERSVVSEIEDVRGTSSRLSVESIRTPIVGDIKRGSLSGMHIDEDLPVFEDDMDLIFSQSQSHMLTNQEPVFADTIPIDQMFEQRDAEVVAVDDPEESKLSQKKNPKRGLVMGKRKVQIDGRIEFSDKQFRQRIADPSCHLRKLYSVHPSIRVPHQTRIVEQDEGLSMIFQSGLCNELAEVYKIAHNTVPLPFPLKRPRKCGVESEEPENVRRSTNYDSMQQGISTIELSKVDVEIGLKSMETPSVVLNNSGVPFDFANDDEIFPIDPVVIPPSETNVGDMNLKSVQESDKQPIIEQLKSVLKSQIMLDSKLLLRGMNRREASRAFLELLQLKAENAIEMTQRIPYDSINIATKI